MATSKTVHTAKRLGYKLRQAAAWMGRKQGHFIKWQVSKGISFKYAKLVVILLDLALIAMLLFTAFWVYLPVFIILALLHLAGNRDIAGSDFDIVDMRYNKDEELRYGHAGYGRYDLHGFRLDQHDPNSPEDDVM